MRFSKKTRRSVVVALGLTLAAAAARGQETSDLRAEQAIEFYDSGDYTRARDLLESIDADGAATGPLLYRLSFARRATGDPNGEREALQRALAVLQRENETATDLETPFYLANALRNANRAGEAREVARGATDRFESGAFPQPKSGIERFRLAKLYQDQGRHDGAAEHYRAALDAFAETPGSFPANVAWARRYLGDLAYSRGDWDGAAESFRAMIDASPNPPASDLDRLGAVEARRGRYAEAAELWERAYRRDRTRGDQANYRWKLALQATSFGTLPPTGPDGAPWDDHSRQSLETIMQNAFARATEILSQASEAHRAGVSSPDEGERRAELRELHTRFIAAAMNYTLRNFPLRETAFTGGFAPFIFHANRWDWPGDPKRRPTPKRPRAKGKPGGRGRS